MSDLGFENLTVKELFTTNNATLVNVVLQQIQVGVFFVS